MKYNSTKFFQWIKIQTLFQNYCIQMYLRTKLCSFFLILHLKQILRNTISALISIFLISGFSAHMLCFSNSDQIGAH